MHRLLKSLYKDCDRCFIQSMLLIQSEVPSPYKHLTVHIYQSTRCNDREDSKFYQNRWRNLIPYR